MLWGTETKEFMNAFCTQFLTCAGDLFMLLNNGLHSAGPFLLNGKSTLETVDCHFSKELGKYTALKYPFLFVCERICTANKACLLHKLFSINMCAIGPKISVFESNSGFAD